MTRNIWWDNIKEERFVDLNVNEGMGVNEVNGKVRVGNEKIHKTEFCIYSFL